MREKTQRELLAVSRGLAIAGRLCAFCSEVLCWPLAGTTGSVTRAESLGRGMGPGQRIHGVWHAVTRLKNMKVGVGAAEWQLGIYSESHQ